MRWAHADDVIAGLVCVRPAAAGDWLGHLSVITELVQSGGRPCDAAGRRAGLLALLADIITKTPPTAPQRKLIGRVRFRSDAFSFTQT